ncbi:MAG: winged helix-turn-helix domain-containing protein [Methylocystis sp.]
MNNATALARIGELEEEVRQLRALLAPVTPAMSARAGMSRRQREFCAAVLAASPNVATRERLIAALGLEESEDPVSNLSVIVCHLRKAMRGAGIEIATEWGRGYYVTQECAERLRAFMSGEGAAA